MHHDAICCAVAADEAEEMDAPGPVMLLQQAAR
jgi:hypothetical protein